MPIWFLLVLFAAFFIGIAAAFVLTMEDSSLCYGDLAFAEWNGVRSSLS